jgi:hypothetical protein
MFKFENCFKITNVQTKIVKHKKCSNIKNFKFENCLKIKNVQT